MTNFKTKFSKIIAPCQKHKILPDLTVCSHCVSEISEWSRAAETTMAEMPRVFRELHNEGTKYYNALESISHGTCLCPDGHFHFDDCAIGIAQLALEGWEARILHRPATGAALNLTVEALVAKS